MGNNYDDSDDADDSDGADDYGDSNDSDDSDDSNNSDNLDKREQENSYNISDDMKKLQISNKDISDEDIEYKNMTVNQLKSILNDKNLPLSGNKTKLIQRIKDNK